MSSVLKVDINSRYLKPIEDRIGHHIWTEDGTYYRQLYVVLSQLNVISTKKLVESLNERTKTSNNSS